jgi:hypothetical protein
MLTLRALAVAGALLFAGSASALSITYDMTGSSMAMVNSAGCAPCTVAVTGTLTLDDDLGGNILLTDLSLAHGPYEVALGPGVLSVVIERTSIGLGAGSVPGTGTTVSGNVLYGTTTLAQTGTVTCTPGLFSCALAGLPAGVTPLTSTLPGIDLDTWSFDAFGDLLGSILYTNDLASGATETLNLVGSPTVIPEPGTMLLVGAGLVGIALRRRARA